MAHPEQAHWSALADAAAALLPGAPDEGDVVGYLAWRELVWGTAERLAHLAGPDALRVHAAGAAPVRSLPTVSGADLLGLAADLALAPVPRDGAALPTGEAFEHHR